MQWLQFDILISAGRSMACGNWEVFASGGLPDKPPGFQLVLWDTNARINGLVATDLETLVAEVLTPFPHNAGFADGLFIMTTATDHKNNLNRSVLKGIMSAPCV